MEDLENKNQYLLLVDQYSILLTDKQKMILDEYFNEDLSLSEIAENHNISKSAVYDTLKKSLEKLKEYETKLRCVYKEKKILQILSENLSAFDNYGQNSRHISPYSYCTCNKTW